jgi:hypothetical protein
VKTLRFGQVILKCYRHGSSLNCMKINQRTLFGSRMRLPLIFVETFVTGRKTFFRIDGLDGVIVGTWLSVLVLHGPRPNLLWLLPLGFREGQSVCATATCKHTWFAELDYCDCWDHHTRHADQNCGKN